MLKYFKNDLTSFMDIRILYVSMMLQCMLKNIFSKQKSKQNSQAVSDLSYGSN
jgi:hypothetical protein